MTYGLDSIDPRGVRLIPGDHVTAWTGGTAKGIVWDRSSAIVNTSNKKMGLFFIPTTALRSGKDFP
jgi:hypothetical protein